MDEGNINQSLLYYTALGVSTKYHYQTRILAQLMLFVKEKLNGHNLCSSCVFEDQVKIVRTTVDSQDLIVVVNLRHDEFTHVEDLIKQTHRLFLHELYYNSALYNQVSINAIMSHMQCVYLYLFTLCTRDFWFT